MQTRLMALFAAVLAVGLASCQGRDKPVSVSGTVTVDGRPLREGVVVFEPADPARGQMRQAAVVDGAFALPVAEGVLPGLEFRVIVRGFRKTGRKLPYANPDGSWDETEQYLPREYNSATTLKVTTAADPAANQYVFELRSRPDGR